MANERDDFLAGDGEAVDGEAVPAVDTVVEPTPTERSKKPWGVILGGGAAAAAVVVATFILAGGGSEIDTAQSTPAVEEEIEELEDIEELEEDDVAESNDEVVGSIEEALDEAEVEIEEVFEADFAEEAMESAFFGGGPMTAVFDGEQFVSLTMNEAGWALRTSTDGLDWVESPVTGLPSEGYASWLDVQDGTYVAAFDVYSETDGQSSSIATSTDGTSWSAIDLPAIDDASPSGISLTNDGVMALFTVYNDTYQDEMDILIELGILAEGDFESYCGFDQIEPGGDIMIYLCNFEDEEVFEDDFEFDEPSEEELDALAAAYDAATTDEERAEIEQQLDALYEEAYGGSDPFEEDAVIITPGEPGFAELSEIREEQNDQSMPIITVTGPIGGPFDVVDEFVAEGYTNGIASTDAGVFISVDTFDEENFTSQTAVLSWNGNSWAEVGSLPAGVNGQLHGLDDMLLLSGNNDFGQSANFVSVDGVSWTEASFGSDIANGYSDIITGPAGAVAVTMGYDGPGFGGPSVEVAVIEKDGFILEINAFTGESSLTGADGVVIYELDSAREPSPESEIANINPISGDITFLDPETGNAMVVISSDEISEAFGFEEFVEEDFVEPERLLEVQATTNGTTWTVIDVPEFQNLSPNTSIIAIAVGDDEAIFSLDTYAEPPAELFAFEEEGREPTEAEIEALELFDGGSAESTYVRVPLG